MGKFKIFYSWQSDLPRKHTRNVVRECIDRAIISLKEAEAVEAIREEATLGVTGSPDIVKTLFSKIADCDLFIADVSLCFEKASALGSSAPKKYSPNPNVLVELGYAVGCLGWDRIICCINTEYGEIEKLPFDIRQRRVTLCDENKKNNIQRIIENTILQLSQKPHQANKKDIIDHVIRFISDLRKCVEREKLNNKEIVNLQYKKRVIGIIKTSYELDKNNLREHSWKTFFEKFDKHSGLSDCNEAMKKYQRAFSEKFVDNAVFDAVGYNSFGDFLEEQSDELDKQIAPLYKAIEEEKREKITGNEDFLYLEAVLKSDEKYTQLWKKIEELNDLIENPSPGLVIDLASDADAVIAEIKEALQSL